MPDSNSPSRRQWLALVVFLAASFSAASIGGMATATSVNTWYPLLVKPAWNPPPWVFGPVWSLLYALMSVAAWRVWLKRALPGAQRVLGLFFVQLGLNALWSVLFFGLRRPDLAFGEVIVLWLALVAVQRGLHRLDRVAAWLWMPYVLWVAFAAVLNGTVAWLNR